jgi:3-(methylthio)propanoyl-CoA dehydrogenase
MALVDACGKVAERLLSADDDDRLAASYPLLTMLATAIAGWLMVRQSAALDGAAMDSEFAAMKRAATRFYVDQIVPEARGLESAAMAPAAALYAISEEAFAAT